MALSQEQFICLVNKLQDNVLCAIVTKVLAQLLRRDMESCYTSIVETLILEHFDKPFVVKFICNITRYTINERLIEVIENQLDTLPLEQRIQLLHQMFSFELQIYSFEEVLQRLREVQDGEFV